LSKFRLPEFDERFLSLMSASSACGGFRSQSGAMIQFVGVQIGYFFVLLP
jgi:hypothetical protein